MSRQSQRNFALRTKMLMLERGLSVAAIARAIRRPRPTVSTAIHTNRFPRVRQAVMEELGL